MNEITVNTAELGNELVQTVNARELHANLGVRKDFSDWVKAQVRRAGLVEGRDFVTAENLSTPRKGETSVGGRPGIDYHLTIDAAKHVAMMSNTEKGAEIREYFIRIEKAFAARQHQIPSNMALVPRDLLKRCMYLGPKGRPTAQAKYLAKMQLPLIGQIGVTNEFGLTPSQLEEVERANLLSLYAVQAHSTDSSYHIEMQMLRDQKALEQVAKQKAKVKLQKQIAHAQAKLSALETNTHLT